MQDDQDVEIGGWNPMKQTQALLQKNGGLLTNWRIHTPICSPSRSETVSGRYCELHLLLGLCRFAATVLTLTFIQKSGVLSSS